MVHRPLECTYLVRLGHTTGATPHRGNKGHVREVVRVVIRVVSRVVIKEVFQRRLSNGRNITCSKTDKLPEGRVSTQPKFEQELRYTRDGALGEPRVNSRAI